MIKIVGLRALAVGVIGSFLPMGLGSSWLVLVKSLLLYQFSVTEDVSNSKCYCSIGSAVSGMAVAWG